MMKVTLDTWITSDHHWEHPNIRKYAGRPENHFELMRERWIERVGPGDPLLHLGDLVCFGDRSKHPGWIDGLPGDKHLLLGNHDQHTNQWYEAAGFTVLGKKPFAQFVAIPDSCDTTWNDAVLVLFSHEPDFNGAMEWRGGEAWDVNVHGHIHSNPYYSRTPALDYRNVSVEMTDYAPVRLGDVLLGNAGGRRYE